MFIQNIDDGNKIRIVLPFKDEIAANAVRRQLGDLSNKIAVTLQPIFVSKKLEQDLKPKEIKSSIVSQPCVVYKFASDLCDADYCNIFLYQDGKGKGPLKLKAQMARAFPGFLSIKYA